MMATSLLFLSLLLVISPVLANYYIASNISLSGEAVGLFSIDSKGNANYVGLLPPLDESILHHPDVPLFANYYGGSNTLYVIVPPGFVLVLDLTTGVNKTLKAPVPTGAPASLNGLCITPNGRILTAFTQGVTADGSVWELDPKTGKLDFVFTTDGQLFLQCVNYPSDPNNGFLYTNSYSSQYTLAIAYSDYLPFLYNGDIDSARNISASGLVMSPQGAIYTSIALNNPTQLNLYTVTIANANATLSLVTSLNGVVAGTGAYNTDTNSFGIVDVDGKNLIEYNFATKKVSTTPLTWEVKHYGAWPSTLVYVPNK